MGTIRNEMTIVHHWDKDKIESVREDAIKFFNEVADEDVAESMISPIMQSHINQEYTFVINGDCSKIGWETSERYHKARMKWCEKHKYDAQNIIVINFGEDDEPCYIVFDSKAENRYDLLPPCEQESEEVPCNTCGYEEGSIYCKEHCPHEAKVINENISKGFEDFTRMMFKQGEKESEE